MVEDERRLAALLARGLREAGHDVDVRHTGSDALFAATAGGCDTVVLDLMLPGMDGIAVCQALRRRGSVVPVLMLTARGAVPDRVAGPGRRTGSRRDRVAGPGRRAWTPVPTTTCPSRSPSTSCSPGCGPLHRRVADAAAADLVAGDLRLDPARRCVTRARRPSSCPRASSTSSPCCSPTPGGACPGTRSSTRVWDGETDLRSNVIDVYIATLRGKVDKPFGRHAIATLRGVGYRLEADGG